MTALALRRTDMGPIVDAVNKVTQEGLDEFGGWQPLADLSSHTIFEMIDADPDSIVVDRDGRFEAIANVYVMLVYGSGDDEERMSDEYVATVRGTVTEGTVSIDTIDVDTDPFYA